MPCLNLCCQDSRSQSQISSAPVPQESNLTSSVFSDSQTKSTEQENATSATETENTIKVREIWQEVHMLERQHSMSSKYRKFGHTLEPVVEFFAKFGPAIDSAVQYGSTPSTLVWGALKAVILIAGTSITYFYYIENAMKRLSGIISICHEYEKMFMDEKRVRVSLMDLCHEVHLFIGKIRTAVITKSWRIFLKNATKSVEYDFQGNFEQIKRYRETFHNEVTLAHRLRVDASSKEIQGNVRSLLNDNNVVRASAMKREANDNTQSLLARLNPVDVYSDLDRITQKHFPGTGDWILKSTDFENWRNAGNGLDEKPALLWINGRPGTGKTIISSTIIRSVQFWVEENESQAQPVAFFYCDSGDSIKRSALHICASILAQIVCQLSDVPEAIITAYKRAKRYGRRHASPSDNLFAVLERVAIRLSGLFIVLDGLDECEELASTVTAFADISRRVPSSRVCFLSRRIPAIKTSLNDSIDVQLKHELVQPDINAYLHSSLDFLLGKGSQINKDAFNSISERADGMFLFASLSVQALRQAIDMESLSAAVKQIPKGLDGTYIKILDRLWLETAPRKLLARRIFLWVCCSTRPVSWRELQFALSWNQERKCFVEGQRPFRDIVLELCSPLVEYRADQDSFHLVHFSVWEFFCRKPDKTAMSKAQAWFYIDEAMANYAIAKASIACLMRSAVTNTVIVDIFQHHFLQYVTLCHHLVRSNKDVAMNQQYLQFVADPKNRSTWIMRYLLLDKESLPLQRLRKLQKALRDNTSSPNQISAAEDLADLQRALILLSELPSSVQEGESISNFERLMCVRDLAREYTMANKLPQGIELFTRALHTLRNKHGEDFMQLPWILNSLGIFHDQQSNTELAASLQRQALVIQETPPNGSP